MEKLNDIYPMEQIDVNLLVYMVIILCCLALISFIIKTVFFKEKVLTPKQNAYLNLKNIDFQKDSTKKIAYDFTIYGKECLNDEMKKEFNIILNQLEVYKYKKDVKKFDDLLIYSMKSYIKEMGTYEHN